MHTCQPPEFQNLETSRNPHILSRNPCIVRPGDLMKTWRLPGKPGELTGMYVPPINGVMILELLF